MSDENKLRLIDDPGLLSSNPVSELTPQKQYFPRPLATAFKVILLPAVLLDLFCRKLARKVIRPPLVKTGACKKRGNCCYYITVKKEKGVLDFLSRFWMEQVHGFYLREQEPTLINDKEYYVMGCRYLKEDGSCGQYTLRPMICREWPKVEIFGHPQILKGCGYSFAARKKEMEPLAEELRSSLQSSHHP